MVLTPTCGGEKNALLQNVRERSHVDRVWRSRRQNLLWGLSAAYVIFFCKRLCAISTQPPCRGWYTLWKVYMLWDYI